MVIVIGSMTNPRNSILWVGVKLDFVSECTVFKMLKIPSVSGMTRFRINFIVSILK